MIVRTYTRRPRCSSQAFSDGGGASTSSSSVVLEDPAHSSQDSFGSLDPYGIPPPLDAFDSDPYGFEELRIGGFGPEKAGLGRGKKKPPTDGGFRRGELGVGESGREREALAAAGVASTSTLMEAQEFGEMMEHVDEVNFALDGLRRGQPARIRRASLLSLLSICATSQQRRLLRAQGIAKRILDAVLGLSLDDSPSILAASALLFLLANDVQDDHLLESTSCIKFLISLLNPPSSNTFQEKTTTIGARLLGVHKNNTGSLNGSSNSLDSSSSAIKSKVHEILLSCNVIKHTNSEDNGMERPELSSKWIVLLTIEKACLSTVSFEDTSGAARKIGGNFKERLRELGGLDVIFDVAASCHSKMKGLLHSNVHSVWDLKDGLALESVVLLLKCLKIMENATFLSKENQNHLLGMNTKLEKGLSLSCVGLIISSIKIISGLSLPKDSSHSSREQRSNVLHDCFNILPELTSGTHSKEICKDNCNRNFSNEFSGYCSIQQAPNVERSESCQKRQRLSMSESSVSATETNSMPGTACSTKKKEDCSGQASCNKKIGCLIGGLFLNGSGSKSASMKGSSQWISINGSKVSQSGSSSGLINTNGSKRNPFPGKRSLASEDGKVDDGYDPFAFDEDELRPSKWEVLATSQKNSQSHQARIRDKQLEDKLDHLLTMTSTEVANEENYDSSLDLCKTAIEKGSNPWEECLLTAVKVLMNLTNDNPVGCQQIAASGGLDTMASLIISHFPSFEQSSSSTMKLDHNLSFSKKPEDSSTLMNKHLNDHELEFLVAILGLLVNLVEKDSQNRSRLASARFPVLQSRRLPGKEGQKDVISLLCFIFLANQGAGESADLGCDAEAALLQGEREAEMMIIEAYSALLLAFLSTESRSAREAIAGCLPNKNLKILVPVLERFVEFHLSLNMISSETHTIVSEVIESCRMP